MKNYFNNNLIPNYTNYFNLRIIHNLISFYYRILIYLNFYSENLNIISQV